MRFPELFDCVESHTNETEQNRERYNPALRKQGGVSVLLDLWYISFGTVAHIKCWRWQMVAQANHSSSTEQYIGGGQGRSAQNVEDDANSLSFLLLFLIGCILGAPIAFLLITAVSH